MATGQLNLGRRMSKLYEIPNEDYDSTGDEQNIASNQEYENTPSIKQGNGLSNYPVSSRSVESKVGTINKGYDPADNAERGTKRYENQNFHKQRELQHKTTAPRKKVNAVYEPMNLGVKNGNQRQLIIERMPQPAPPIVERKPSEVSEESSGESCFSRLVLFCILLIAVVALVLVLLIMMGKIGPNSGCSCGNEGVNPRSAGSTGSSSGLILTEIEELRNNVSRAHHRVELRKMEITQLKAELSTHKLEQNVSLTNLASQDEDIRAAMEKANMSWFEAKNDITTQSDSSVLELQQAYNTVAGVLNNANVTWESTRNTLAEKVTSTETTLLTLIQKLSSINGTHTSKDFTLQKMIDDVTVRSNTVNVSRHQEADEVFLSIMKDLDKVNTTFQMVDTEIGNILSSVGPRVAAANSSLLDQVKSLNQVFQSKDQKLNSDLTSVNTTLTAKARVAEQKPGVTGPKGYTGPPGSQGAQGTPGANGPGDLSSCTRETKTNTPVSLTISTDVPSTKLVMSVKCSGLDEKVTSRLTVTGSPPTQYQCSCFDPAGPAVTVCVIHYWLCNK